MDWLSYKKKVKELYAVLDDSLRSKKKLQEIYRFVQEQKSYPPHLYFVFDQLNNLGSNEENFKNVVKILDHGCGGSMTILYLACCGYKNIYGVDIKFKHNIKNLNQLLREEFHFQHDAISVYNGSDLPFEDSFFDFIFSQQVMEHVAQECLLKYMNEEKRCLKPSGVVYHQIPHLLIPWDSHARLWFVHYFPASVRRRLYSFFQKDTEYYMQLLNLKSKFYFLNFYRENFSFVKDLTTNRIKKMPEKEYYDGNYSLRRMLNSLGHLPIFDSLISTFVMMDMVAKNPKK